MLDRLGAEPGRGRSPSGRICCCGRCGASGRAATPPAAVADTPGRACRASFTRGRGSSATAVPASSSCSTATTAGTSAWVASSSPAGATAGSWPRPQPTSPTTPRSWSSVAPQTAYAWYRPGVPDLLDRWEHTGPGDSTIKLGVRARRAPSQARLPRLHVRPCERHRGHPDVVGEPDGWTRPRCRPGALPAATPRRSSGSATGSSDPRSVRTPKASTRPPSCWSPRSCVPSPRRREPEKTIVFTDSRDDAASTAMGLAENSFADLVRQLVRRSLDAEDDVVRILRDGAPCVARSPGGEMVRYDQLRQQHPDVARAYWPCAMGLAQTSTDERSPTSSARARGAGDVVARPRRAADPRAGAPGRPSRGAARLAARARRRTALEPRLRTTRARGVGSAPARAGPPAAAASIYRRYLVMALGDALLGGRGRDLEMTLVGHLALVVDEEVSSEMTEVAVVRPPDLRAQQPVVPRSPAGQERACRGALTDYLQRVAARHGWTEAQVAADVTRLLATALDEGSLALEQRRPTTGRAAATASTCGSARRAPPGTCTPQPASACGRAARASWSCPSLAPLAAGDYYVRLSKQEPARLAVAELTGQTSPPALARATGSGGSAVRCCPPRRRTRARPRSTCSA